MNEQNEEVLRRLSELERKVDALLQKDRPVFRESPPPVPKVALTPKPAKPPINLLPIFAVICFDLSPN